VLSLTRRVGQKILIGDDVTLKVLSIQGGKVRIGIEAPRELPVHRAELVERVEEENLRALNQALSEKVAEGLQITFPEGLFGLRRHTDWVLCDLHEDNPIRCLVSVSDPSVQLLVLDADLALPDYPVAAAVEAHGADEECAVAVVVTVPAKGGAATANTLAPLVIGLESRRGRQLVLERTGLGVGTIIGQAAPATAAMG
jgi:carbon storage regulator